MTSLPILPFPRPPAQAFVRFALAALLALLVPYLAGCAGPGGPGRTDALDHLPASGLDAHQQLLVQLQEAQAAVNELRPRDALDNLSTVPPEDTPPGMLEAYHQLRAEAYTLTGNYLEAARERVWFDALLPDGRRRHENQLAIWESLSHLSDPALRRLSRTGSVDALNGWMELVLISRQNRHSQQRLDDEIRRWTKRYPGHPASAVLLRELLAQIEDTRQVMNQLTQVALLVPLSGPLAEAGQAVRDGFVAARLSQPRSASRPALRIYDVGQGPGAATQQYRRAVAEGASVVVGPLGRESVRELARSGRLEVPVLALNYLGDRGGPRGFYQFGLSPEDEARQVAWQARLDAHQKAIVLVPGDGWGERVKTAFLRHWTELGGTTVQVATYDPQEVDFSAGIKSMLHLDLSTQRHREITRIVRRELEFEPRRRKDVDFIFLAAFARQARLLQPQLRFHHAADLPVYSTSHVYSGVPDINKNRDLNGIRFCDMPWIIHSDGPWKALHDGLQATSTAGGKQPRLLALGIDAYNILPYLSNLGQSALSRYNGVTGNLYVDRDRRVHRELVWGYFRQGRLKSLSNKVN